MKYTIHFLAGLLIFLASCSGKGIFSANKKSTKATASTLQNDVNTIWKEMMQSDDQKIADLKRLLQELSYTKDYNQTTWTYVNSMVENLPAQRFTQHSMTSSQIDQYDLSTDQAIKKVFDLLEDTDEMKAHPLGEELKEDIQKADNDVIVYRIKYDVSAKKFNAFVEENSKTLSKLGPPYSEFKSLSLFELPE